MLTPSLAVASIEVLTRKLMDERGGTSLQLLDGM